jgi:hypothetical protein
MALENELKLRLDAEALAKMASGREPVIVRPQTPPPKQEGLSAKDMLSSIGGFLRASMQKKDLDNTKNSYLDCMRKFFEEARKAKIDDIDGEIFSTTPRLMDNSVKRDEFIFSLLNKDQLTLTRSEIASVCQLCANPSAQQESISIS